MSNKIIILLNATADGLKITPKFHDYLMKNIERLRVDFPKESDYDLNYLLMDYVCTNVRLSQAIVSLAFEFGLNDISADGDVRHEIFPVEIDKILLKWVDFEIDQNGCEQIEVNFRSFYQHLREMNISNDEIIVQLDAFSSAISAIRKV